MDVTKQNRDYKSLQPIAQQAYLLFMDECKKQGIDIFVTEFYRSQARQNYLYEQGRTRPGKVVTWTRNSNHTSKMAWDIAVNPPRDLYDRNVINKAGRIAISLGIEWGGSWDTPDTPHFQVPKNWKEPKKEEENMNKEQVKSPQWQKDAILRMCEKYKLDKDLWTSKASKELTVGEFFAILEKVVK